MPLQLVQAAALAERKQDVLATAAQYIQLPDNPEQPSETAEQAARSSALAAVAIHWRGALKRQIEQQIEETYADYTMIEGDCEDATDATAWHAGLEDAVIRALCHSVSPPLVALIREVSTGADLHEPGRIAEVADEIAAMVADAGMPQAGNIGKFLASVGIAKIELAWLASRKNFGEQSAEPDATTPAAGPDDAPAPTPAERVAEWRATGAQTGSSPPAVPPAHFLTQAQPAPATAPASAPAKTPDKAAISRAYQLLDAPSTADTADLAARLGVGRSTVANWMTGRNSAKCAPAQAAILLADITRRMKALQEAADIFALVA